MKLPSKHTLAKLVAGQTLALANTHRSTNNAVRAKSLSPRAAAAKVQHAQDVLNLLAGLLASKESK